MNLDFPFFPEQASTVAPKVDALYFFALSVSAFFSLLIAVLIFVFFVKFRRKRAGEIGDREHESLFLEVLWSVVPFVIAMVMFGWGAVVFLEATTAPADAVEYFATVVAIARWVFGPTMNLQVPPNLTREFAVYLDAGINDWGGVSPLTIDWVNPEAPWPHLDRLHAATESSGFELRQRLPVYPEFLTDHWVDPALLPKLVNSVDQRGYALPVEQAAT